MRYRITNRHSGADLGTYEAESPPAAYDAMLADAGYGSREEIAATLSLWADTLEDDLLISEVAA